ncbi:predicted protein, partial [Nematostella vectensis]
NLYTLAHIPQPMQRGSEIAASFVSGVTSIHNFPEKNTTTKRHDFLHSWRHLLGLHLSVLTMAIRVSFSCVLWSALNAILLGRK